MARRPTSILSQRRPLARTRASAAAIASLLLLVPLVGSAGGGGGGDGRRLERRPSASAAAVAPPDDDRLWIEMRNVDLHVDERAVIHVRSLRGEVLSTHAGEPATLDDPRSFSIRVTSATIALDGDGLSALLNEQAFAYPGAPLRRLRTRIAAPHVVQRGILHRGVDLPFEITGAVSLEPDGRVRLHPVRTRILGADGDKLLRAFGLHLDGLIDLRKARGVSVRGNDLLLAPTLILPPPAIAGRLRAIRVEGSLLVQEFERLADDSVFDGGARPDSAAPNFVDFRGGRLRFGRLTMTRTDLQIVDADSRDPLDLYLARYSRQLVAGTSRTLPNDGLRVLMPDYHALGAPPAAAAAATTVTVAHHAPTH
ncbi:MAG TPA: hypothetical protein VFJ74_01045 [Gemmatimonadaceae bacterium]|nr:hypothetical protein [Gemmatimonadaceae bacterium]